MSRSISRPGSIPVSEGPALSIVWRGGRHGEILLPVVVGTALSTLLGVVTGFVSVRLGEVDFRMITLSFSMALWREVRSSRQGLGSTE